MPYRSHGDFIVELRKFLSLVEEYTQAHLFADTQNHGVIRALQTIVNAETHERLHDRNFDTLAASLSTALRRFKAQCPDPELLDPLNTPRLGWLLERLLHEIEPLLEACHLMLDHEDRYLVEDYRISLTVCPYPGGKTPIEYPMQGLQHFEYDNLASVRYDLLFSEENARQEPGFKLAYGTHLGRLKLFSPEERFLAEDRGYRLQRNSLSYLPDPRAARDHKLQFLVYNGYGQGHEMAHFSLGQPALYRSVSLTLDLSSYPDGALSQLPELIIVPILTDRPYDCCDIAKKGKGFPVDPDKQQGYTFKWTFTDLQKILICVRWDLDRTKLPTEPLISPERLIRMFG